MKKSLLVLLALCAAGAAFSQETAAVDSSLQIATPAPAADSTAAAHTQTDTVSRWAQRSYADSIENANKYFVFTYTGEFIAGNSVVYKRPIFGASYITIDTKEITSRSIAFYKNQQGFYANAQAVNGTGKPAFSPRVSKGKINLYERETVSPGAGYSNPTTGMYMAGGTTKKVEQYYNTGFGELKRANYKNLSSDLADNQVSMKYLNEYHQLSQTQTGFMIAGAALIVGGFATLIHKENTAGENPPPYSSENPRAKEVDISGNLAAIFLGVGCTTVSYFISLSKPAKLRSALDAYN